MKVNTESNNRNNPYFNFGLQGEKDSAELLLSEFPMTARNKIIADAQLKAVNTVLSNITIGEKLAVRNISNLTNSKRGYSRKILLDVFKHLKLSGLIERNNDSYSSSTITFLNKIKRYIPKRIIDYPESTIYTHMKGEFREVIKINTAERKELNRRLRAWWNFIKQHDIEPGITTNDFKIFNECEIEVFNKPPLIKPNKSDILPYIVFNDRDLTMGGRMYGAFWIGMKKELRRGILIDGLKTCDIDGKGMHVQLLYRQIGEPLPEGDIYIYTDEKRKITKNLMLLMMNTSTEVSPENGRKQVMRTYRKRFSKEEEGLLLDYIRELEGLHHKILPLLYKPNWGQLQKTEAGIMLNIMENAMNESIVVLPVHDGCLCKIDDKGRVLELFKDQGIIAEENRKHLLPVPVEEKSKILEAFYAYKKVA